MTTNEILLTTKQASEYLQITVGTLAVWRTNKTYNIPYLKCGGRVRYRKSDLDAWLAGRENNREVCHD